MSNGKGKLGDKDQVTITSGGSSDTSEVSDKTFEDLLQLCGEAGRWQLKLFLVASFCGMITAFHNLAYAFIGATPDHWCKLPHHPDYPSHELKNLTIPEADECHRCEVQGDWATGNFTAEDIDCGKRVTCSRWDYDTSEFQSTIAEEFNLVCGQKYTAFLVQSCFMFGILLGSPLFGALSDRLGRKLTLIISTILFCAAAPAVGIAPNYSFMMFCRFFLGFATPGVYGTSYVLVIETIGLDWRGLAGNLFCLPFAFGYMMLPLFAYYIRDWRELQLALSGPAFLLIITWWLLPESPRWLLRTGRLDEAEAILKNIAKTNKRLEGLPQNFRELCLRVSDVEKIEQKKQALAERLGAVLQGYWSLFQTPRIRRRTLVIYFCWMSISMIYYGIALNSPNLSTNRYMYVGLGMIFLWWRVKKRFISVVHRYTFIGGVLEIPSYFMVPPLIRFFGRRLVFSGLILITGVSLLSSLLFTSGSAVVVTLALVGKLLIGSAYALVYLYATEVFPTLLRTYGLGTASMIGRIGSVMAPFIVDVIGDEDNTFPTIVFGSIAIVAGALAFLLPETRNKILPETVRDVEQM